MKLGLFSGKILPCWQFGVLIDSNWRKGFVLRRFVNSSIQGYAVEIFADTFSHGGQGLRTGVQVDTVAYWSAVVMALVRLGTLTAH